jgi:heat shock protein HslJ
MGVYFCRHTRVDTGLVFNRTHFWALTAENDHAAREARAEMNKQPLFLALLCTIVLSSCCAPSVGKEIELDDTRWKLQSMKDQELLANTLITLKFRGSEITGSAGCNSYGAEYTTQSRNSFAIRSTWRTVEGCIEPEGVMQQEEQYIRTLGDVTSYRVGSEGLVFSDGQGKVLLQYERMSEFKVNPVDLVGKTWQLTSATGLDGERLSAFTIRFDGTTLSGTTICREYAGNYQAADDSLDVTFLQMTTDFDCDEIDGATEGGYTTLLENVEQYNISQAQLELYTRRGEKLVFELVAAE